MLVAKKRDKKEVDTERECIALFKFTVHTVLVFLGICYLLYNLIDK